MNIHFGDVALYVAVVVIMNPVWANTWTVTSGGSIQSTINASNSGDTIEVGSGTYVECLDPNGKDIDIIGTGTVVINGSSCTCHHCTLRWN